MFDKILFDRNAFDRSVSSDGIAFSMLSSSKLSININLKTPVGNNLSGTGLINSRIVMRQNIEEAFSGSGVISDLIMILRRSTEARINGSGALSPNIVVRTPIQATLIGSSNISIDSRLIARQNLRIALTGTGAIIPHPIFKTDIATEIKSSGEMSPRLVLSLPLKIQEQGQGIFALRRLGALNENVIELIGINLLPGETVTIDTDLLQVLFGSVEDVSSITTESVFFELNPGENEIAIDTDSDSSMEVVAIWQNRWL